MSSASDDASLPPFLKKKKVPRSLLDNDILRCDSTFFEKGKNSLWITSNYLDKAAFLVVSDPAITGSVDFDERVRLRSLCSCFWCLVVSFHWCICEPHYLVPSSRKTTKTTDTISLRLFIGRWSKDSFWIAGTMKAGFNCRCHTKMSVKEKQHQVSWIMESDTIVACKGLYFSCAWKLDSIVVH